MKNLPDKLKILSILEECGFEPLHKKIFTDSVTLIEKLLRVGFKMVKDPNLKSRKRLDIIGHHISNSYNSLSYLYNAYINVEYEKGKPAFHRLLKELSPLKTLLEKLNDKVTSRFPDEECCICGEKEG